MPEVLHYTKVQMNMTSRRSCCLILALLACAATLAEAGSLAGKVRVANAPALDKNRKRYPVNSGGGVSEEGPVVNPVQDVILYLDGAKSGHGFHPRPTMTQHNKMFAPRVLPVKVGTTVEFPNLDPFYHNVFSFSKLKKFDLGRYPTGQAKSLTFDTPAW